MNIKKRFLPFYRENVFQPRFRLQSRQKHLPFSKFHTNTQLIWINQMIDDEIAKGWFELILIFSDILQWMLAL